jgi:hypothetical protein
MSSKLHPDTTPVTFEHIARNLSPDPIAMPIVVVVVVVFFLVVFIPLMICAFKYNRRRQYVVVERIYGTSTLVQL